MAENLDRFVDAYSTSFAYELDNRLMLHWYPERVMARARGRSLLELGLGHGYSTVRFADRFDRHVVVDGSEAVIDQFRSRYPDCRAEIVCAYFEEFITDERFDAIVMGFILEHVEDPAVILRRYRTTLKPGGQLFVAVPNAEALNKRVGQAAGLLDDLSRLTEADLALGHRRLFTVDSLTDLATSTGYVVEHVEGIFLKPVATRQLQQLGLSEEILQGFLRVGVDYPELCVGILMELRP
jgi:2-polyprenyl-3-methyl-5-hydroxy-6-metoxy-1,4-benzoquinol methylase